MATASRRREGRLTPTQARAARRSRRQRKRRFTRFAAFSAVVIIAVLFIGSLFAGSLPITLGGTAGPDGPGERFADQGNTHIITGEGHPPYNSVPGTSGWHYDYADGGPARWDIYKEPLPDEVLIHNLEHGGIGIHYNCPEGCDDLVEKLEAYFQVGREIIVSPYPDMDAKIALTAWTFLDAFDEYDDERIKAFVNAHMNSPTAPESLAR